MDCIGERDVAPPAAQAVAVIVKAGILALIAGLLFRDLILPDTALDPWIVPAQYGFLHHIDFARYLIISYGPLSFLSTRLFHPDTWRLTLLLQLACPLLALWPILTLRWSAPLILLLLGCALVNRIYYLNDGIVFAAIFSTFLSGMLGRRWPALIGAAVTGILVMAKSSFFFAAAPLFLMADLRNWLRTRSLPTLIPVLLAATTASFMLSGQPLTSVPRYVQDAYEIAKYYSQAMSLSFAGSDDVGRMSFVVFTCCVAGVLALRGARNRTGASEGAEFICIGFGLLWLGYVAYKASYVRADAYHYYIGWNALLLIAPVALYRSSVLLQPGHRPGSGPRIGPGRRPGRRPGTADRSAPTEGPGHQWTELVLVITGCAAFLITTDFRPALAAGHGNLTDLLMERAVDKIDDLVSLASWLDPRKPARLELERTMAVRQLALPHLDTGQETVDLYPLANERVIAAGLAYQPRPTAQSYMAYSPYLQQLDLEHWRGPNAPEHLLFRLYDIDGRLPTLALGPSMVEILSRYDADGDVQSNIHLRRRASPRQFEEHTAGSRSFRLDEWVDVPQEPGGLTLASIHLPLTLSGRLRGAICRVEPPSITVQLTSGEHKTYRFVPSMAELGFVLSPDLAPLLGQANPNLQPDLPANVRQAIPVRAFRITSELDSFGPGTVTFSRVRWP